MASESTRPDYRSERAPHKAAPHSTVPRPEDFASVEEFLQLLARAVRQFHTYPPTSPLCTDAIAACHKVFASLERRDRLAIRVTPTELVFDEVGVGAGTIVEQELARRLHRARVIALDIDRIAAPRHFSHFCATVIRCEALARTKTTFAELLAEQGVETIVPLMAYRPEVLAIGAPSAPLCDLVAHEQKRRQTALAAGGPVDYLYPPDKGWIRLDPGARLESVSLIELAVLVDDPADVAAMLLRLTDDDPIGQEGHKAALQRKFSDVAMLFSSLDPRLARVMFGKLARAVLALEPERRNDLLRRSILPGLLDGRADGEVLSDFPDVDLAESLCLLLELETAAPEVLTAALNRLDLSADRRGSVIPLIDARLRRGADIPAGESKEREIDRLARRLVKVDATPGKDFSEFAAFDLSIDDRAASAIAASRDAIGATDLPCAQLGFLSNLVRLEPNPSVVDVFLRRALTHFAELEQSDRWQDLAAWASRYRQLAAELREARADVSEGITNALTAFFVPATRTAALVGLYERGGDARDSANALVAAFGPAVAPGLIALVDGPTQLSRVAAAVALMCEHAPSLAPALVSYLGRTSGSTTRAIVKVLGFAGAGHETVVSDQLGHADEQTSREALRALARIGTTQAAALVADQLRAGSPGRRAAAEEAIWHFPEARAAAQVRLLLGNREFVVGHPDIAARLLARAAHAGTDGLKGVLENLEPLRFHFWNPGLVKVALKARELRVR